MDITWCHIKHRICYVFHFTINNIQHNIPKYSIENNVCTNVEYVGITIFCFELSGKLEGLVTTPSGKQDKVNVIDLGDGTYDIEYVPKELGVYNLDVTFDNVPVPGSPFKFKVVEPGPRKVKVYGPGRSYINLKYLVGRRILLSG